MNRVSRPSIWLVALMASCATPAPPGTTPPASTLPAPREAPRPPPPAPTPTPPPPEPEVPAGAPVRLAWVNPARCLPVCTLDPSAELVAVSEAGEPAAAGTHRVARAAQPALTELMAAARGAGHVLKIASAFRSYRDQARVFKTTKEPGRAARPGHSEHQLGTAIDLRLPTSAAIDWLAEHAPGFGFALSYPHGKQRLTGYRPEPWHVRYVGRELAEVIHQSGGTVEEALRARPDLGESGDCRDCPLPVSRSKCGKVTSKGSCQGTVLTWCYDDALATVDCAASGQRCGPSPETGQPDCL